VRTPLTLPLSFLAVLLFAVPVPAHAEGRPCAVINTLPVFGAFYDRTRGLNPRDRGAAFVRDVVPRFPGYYLVAGVDRPEALIEPAQRFFADGGNQPGLAPLDGQRLAATIRVVGRDFVGVQQRFLQQFPDFACNADIVFGISLGRFDGAMIPGKTRSALLFGIDMISRLQTERTLPVLFDHELFHLYHRQFQAASYALDPMPVWWGSWSEGLAAWVSGQMNPDASVAELFAAPANLPDLIAPQRARTAKLVLDNLDATGDQYRKLFTANESVPGYPPRAGYYFGYLLAAELGRTHTPAELARLGPVEVRQALTAFLERESKGRP
jgi:hypothetical protein